MVEATPPKNFGPLARREARLAWTLLAPTLLVVAIVVIVPLVSIFWISFKPIELSDLRPVVPISKEFLRGNPQKAGDQAEIHYKLRNSSRDVSITDIKLRDVIPEGLIIINLDERCSIENSILNCKFNIFSGGYRETVKISVEVTSFYFDESINIKQSVPQINGNAENILTNLNFSLENFKRIFDGEEFSRVLFVTIIYTFFCTIGAILFGLFAALVL